MNSDPLEGRERARQDEDCAITASGLLRLADAAEQCGVHRYANAYRLVADKLLELNAQGKLREIEAEQERWISVEERLPELGEDVVTWDGQKRNVARRVELGRKTRDWRWDGGDPYVYDSAKTHWQPLPKAPAPPVHKGGL